MTSLVIPYSGATPINPSDSTGMKTAIYEPVNGIRVIVGDIFNTNYAEFANSQLRQGLS
jgi:hypothetical protein